ncbi:MAG: glycosyltransferase [Candidatus Nanopelagicaceae bacterium]
MRVLHVIARMNVGGTATYIANLIHGLEKLGVNNLLLMGNVPKGEVEDSVISTLKYQRIEPLSRELSFTRDRKARKEIERVIESFKPDLIHTHTFKAGFLVRLRRREIPLIHSFHGHHLYDPEFGFIKRNILNIIEKLLAPRATRFITIGKKVRDELLAVKIGRAQQYLSIAPGIAALELVDGLGVRKRFGFSQDETLVLWLGRFTQVKRPDKVVEISRLLPKIRFVMAGGGELLDKVKASAPSNVSFVGFQDKNEMWSIADIALSTSDSEGMPLSLIEAQMAGVPVVSTDVGSVSEILEDGVTGYLAGKDVKELASKLEVVIQDLQSEAKLGKAAKLRAEREFSSSVMADAHLGLYKDVLDKVSR